MAFENNLVWSAYLIGIAAVLDFFDGFIARALKVTSPIGKDLDSLADMVSFGVVPGIVMYKLICISEASFTIYPPLSIIVDENKKSFLPFIALLIPVLSGIRLAKFNNDTRQTDSFIGLPTPANAIFVCSIVLIFGMSQFSDVYLRGICREINGISVSLKSYGGSPVMEIFLKGIFNPVVLVGIAILFSFLLIAPLPLFALKFKHFKWKENEIRYIFLGLAVILIATLQFVGIPLTIILYIFLSIINNLFFKKPAA